MTSTFLCRDEATADQHIVYLSRWMVSGVTRVLQSKPAGPGTSVCHHRCWVASYYQVSLHMSILLQLQWLASACNEDDTRFWKYVLVMEG